MTGSGSIREAVKTVILDSQGETLLTGVPRRLRLEAVTCPRFLVQVT